MAKKISQLLVDNEVEVPTGLEVMELVDDSGNSGAMLLNKIAVLLGIANTAWTPEATFVTPGDLSVSYSVVEGGYFTIGDLVFISGRLSFTPSYSSVSGAFEISGLPFSPVSTSSGMATFSVAGGASALSFPAGTTQMFSVTNPANGRLRINAQGDGSVGNFTSTQFTSGVLRDIRFSCWYQK
jgi:hypothetical protein